MEVYDYILFIVLALSIIPKITGFLYIRIFERSIIKMEAAKLAEEHEMFIEKVADKLDRSTVGNRILEKEIEKEDINKRIGEIRKLMLQRMGDYCIDRTDELEHQNKEKMDKLKENNEEKKEEIISNEKEKEKEVITKITKEENKKEIKKEEIKQENNKNNNDKKEIIKEKDKKQEKNNIKNNEQSLIEKKKKNIKTEKKEEKKDLN